MTTYIDAEDANARAQRLLDEILTLQSRLAEAEGLLRQGVEAIRLTREYVGEKLLPEIEGWSHYDFTAAARAFLARTGQQPVRLFNAGSFALHSGEASTFKIDCDALTQEDWDAVAAWVAPTLAPFGDAVGVPTGGHAFARALRPYVTSGPSLLVDDVLTTGASMEQHRVGEMRGLVLFARAEPPPWVRAIFRTGQQSERCTRCRGNGRIDMLEHCPVCKGSGIQP